MVSLYICRPYTLPTRYRFLSAWLRKQRLNESAAHWPIHLDSLRAIRGYKLVEKVIEQLPSESLIHWKHSVVVYTESRIEINKHMGWTLASMMDVTLRGSPFSPVTGNYRLLLAGDGATKWCGCEGALALVNSFPICYCFTETDGIRFKLWSEVRLEHLSARFVGRARHFRHGSAVRQGWDGGGSFWFVINLRMYEGCKLPEVFSYWPYSLL